MQVEASGLALSGETSTYRCWGGTLQPVQNLRSSCSSQLDPTKTVIRILKPANQVLYIITFRSLSKPHLLFLQFKVFFHQDLSITLESMWIISNSSGKYTGSRFMFFCNIYNLHIFNVLSQKACDQTCLLHAAVVILVITILHWPDDPFQNCLRNKNSLKDYTLKDA